MTPLQYLLLYLSLNFILTIIWLIIPLSVNTIRKNAGLTPKLRIWPIDDCIYHTKGVDTLTGTVGAFCVSTVIATPLLISCIIYRGLHTPIKRVCKYLKGIIWWIVTSKEDRVQVALGTVPEEEE